jgi:hypothetical protein
MGKICVIVAAIGVWAAMGVAVKGPASYSPDNDGFIRNWLLLDPIEVGEKAATHEEDSQKGFFDKEFFDGQNKAMPKPGDKVKVGAAEMAWKDIRVFAGRACEKDQDTKEGLSLKKGLNILRVIVINGNGEFGFCARFTDKDDKPVRNIKVLLAPPKTR